MEDIFKVIFQLDADSKGAVAELSKVNAKYVETNDQLKKSQGELTKLMAREADLLAARAKANNPTSVARYNLEIAKTHGLIERVKRETTDLAKSEVVATGTSKTLGETLMKAFDHTKAQGYNNELKKINEEVKKTGTEIKGSTKEAEEFNKKLKPPKDSTKEVTNEFIRLRGELIKAKSELAEAFSTNNQEAISVAAQKVGELKDRLNDIQTAASNFASGSKFEQFGNIFGTTLGKLAKLDFAGANKQAKQLLDVSKSMTFVEALTGVKDLGGTLLNIGKSLLKNPIFLIGSAVALIVSNFDTLKHSGGIVGKMFQALEGTVIAAKEAFLSLTDAIGLTSHALDKFNEKKLSNLKDDAENIANKFDRLIKLQQAGGKDIIELEKQKNEALLKNTRDQIDALVVKAKVSGELSAEDFKIAKQLAIKLEDLKNEELVIDAAVQKKKIDKAKELAANRLKSEVDLHNRMADLENEAIDKEEARRKKAAEDKIQADLVLHNRMADLENEAIDSAEKRKEEAIQAERDADVKAQGERMKMALEDAKFAEEEAAKEEAARKKRIQDTLNDIQTIANATFSAANQAVNAKIKEVDKIRSLQEKRVEDAKAIADKGNAELLELEEARLEDLNKTREGFVRRQQQLATLELIANTAIAISKAAAQGGVAAGVTIAATLVALVGGLIQARTIASGAAFYEGGYTGDGNPREESSALGRKKYTYHKGEFVFDHHKTGAYRPIFEDIHKGNIDLNDWKNKVVAYETVKFLNATGGMSKGADMKEMEKKLDLVIAAISGQSTSVSLNENGLEMRFKKIRSRSDLIKKTLARA